MDLMSVTAKAVKAARLKAANARAMLNSLENPRESRHAGTYAVSASRALTAVANRDATVRAKMTTAVNEAEEELRRAVLLDANAQAAMIERTNTDKFVDDALGAAINKAAHAGIDNVGNSCFFGSLLQVYAAVSEFINVLEQHKCVSLPTDIPEASFCGACELFNHVVAVRALAGYVVTPSKRLMFVVDGLGLGERLVGKSGQQDVQETHNLLMTLMEAQYGVKLGDVWGVGLTAFIQCATCGIVKRKLELTSYDDGGKGTHVTSVPQLQLHIARRTIIPASTSGGAPKVQPRSGISYAPFSTVKECLDHWTSVEEGDTSNLLECEKCDHRKQGWKRVQRISAAPQYLVLQLVRFVNHSAGGRVVTSKLGHDVEFDAEGVDLSSLMISDSDVEAAILGQVLPVSSADDKGLPGSSTDTSSRPGKYVVMAAIFHTGRTATSGHYMAAVAPPSSPAGSPAVSFLANDHKVTSPFMLQQQLQMGGVSHDDIGQPYMVVLRRRDDPSGGDCAPRHPIAGVAATTVRRAVGRVLFHRAVAPAAPTPSAMSRQTSLREWATWPTLNT